LAVVRLEFDLALAEQLAPTLQAGDLVGGEQRLHAGRELLADAVLALLHRGEIERDLAGLDAVHFELVLCAMEQLGRFEQGLGRNTARVQAGAAERRRVVLVQPGVDAGGLEAELRGADRGRITGGSAADDHDVVIFAHEDPCWRGYCSRANPRAEPISAASIPAVEATVEAAERL